MSEIKPPSKAKYLNTITVETTVRLYEVKCLKCGIEFVTSREGDNKISAIPCLNIACNCAFNVNWGE